MIDVHFINRSNAIDNPTRYLDIVLTNRGACCEGLSSLFLSHVVFPFLLLLSSKCPFPPSLRYSPLLDTTSWLSRGPSNRNDYCRSSPTHPSYLNPHLRRVIVGYCYYTSEGGRSERTLLLPVLFSLGSQGKLL